MLLEKFTLAIFPKEETIMKNVTMDSKTALGMFATTVDTLISTIDAGILSGNYTDAEDSVFHMHEMLNGIVDAMVKHDNCAPSAAAMLKTFINYIVDDKRKIISGKRYISSLECQVGNNAFKAEKEKWEKYITSSADEEYHHTSDSRPKKKWADDDDEDDL